MNERKKEILKIMINDDDQLIEEKPSRQDHNCVFYNWSIDHLYTSSGMKIVSTQTIATSPSISSITCSLPKILGLFDNLALLIGI